MYIPFILKIYSRIFLGGPFRSASQYNNSKKNNNKEIFIAQKNEINNKLLQERK